VQGVAGVSPLSVTEPSGLGTGIRPAKRACRVFCRGMGLSWLRLAFTANGIDYSATAFLTKEKYASPTKQVSSRSWFGRR